MGYTQKCCGSWLMWGCSPVHLKDCSDQRRVFGRSRKQMPLRHSRKVRTTILGATDWPASPQSWDISGNSFQTYERQGGNWELSAWRHRINWALGTPSSPTVKWVTFSVREGKKVDIALTLASLLLFIVSSSQSSRLCDMYGADSFWHLGNRIWFMYFLLDVFPLNGSQASKKRSKTFLSHLMKSNGVTPGYMCQHTSNYLNKGFRSQIRLLSLH